MDIREQIEEKRKARQELEDMMKHPGWLRLKAFMDSARIGRRNNILQSDTGGMDALIDLGQMKAELAGMEFAMNMPQMLIEEAQLEEKALTEEMQNEDLDEA